MQVNNLWLRNKWMCIVWVAQIVYPDEYVSDV